MPVTVKIDVQPRQADVVIIGLVEVEKSMLPFGKGERSEQVLTASQKLEIGYAYSSYNVFVTSEQPVTVLVEVGSMLSKPLLLVIAGASAIVAVAMFFVAR